MSMADRHAERIRCVSAWQAGQLQQPCDHLLHLLFCRTSIADDRLLKLQRGVFSHWHVTHD